jgi:hypothetical protein
MRDKGKRSGSPLHTIQGSNRIKVDLRVEQRLERGGDVVGMIVLIMAVTMPVTTVVMMLAGHDEQSC